MRGFRRKNLFFEKNRRDFYPPILRSPRFPKIRHTIFFICPPFWESRRARRKKVTKNPSLFACLKTARSRRYAAVSFLKKLSNFRPALSPKTAAVLNPGAKIPLPLKMLTGRYSTKRRYSEKSIPITERSGRWKRFHAVGGRNEKKITIRPLWS